MFERFTGSARQSVVAAQHEARLLHHACIGPEHLLYGIAVQADTVAAETLHDQGLTAVDVHRALARLTGSDNPPDEDDPLDEEALASLGIDLAAVRRATEASFGPGALEFRPKGGRAAFGHLPFTKDAKKALELSLREALRLGHNYIGSGHVLLGLLRTGSPVVTRVLTGAGVDVDTLRAELHRRITDQAA